MVRASHKAAAGSRRGDLCPQGSLCWGQLYLSCSCCTMLRAGTHSAQITFSTCSSCTRPKASKMSFQMWDETKHIPGASTCYVHSAETHSEPYREITSGLGDTYGGARTLGFSHVPWLDSPLELEELWDDVAVQVMRFSTMLAQQILCNSQCDLIMGPRGQRQ